MHLQLERSWYINPPTALATHFPFGKKSWLMPLQAMVCCPLGHQLFTSLYLQRQMQGDLGVFLATLGMISCLIFPLNISTSTVFTINNLNENSGHGVPFHMAPSSAGSGQLSGCFQYKRKGNPHSAPTIPLYQAFTFSNIPQAQFLFTTPCGTQTELV